VPEISGMMLSYLKQCAEIHLGEEVTGAVITVPANFNDAQRRATMDAGRIAGLEVLRVLNEPTAAALAYGAGQNMSQRIAIFDFGGGTFDVTVLQVEGFVFEVLATGGDTFLGGDDADSSLMNTLSNTFKEQYGVDPCWTREPRRASCWRPSRSSATCPTTSRPRASSRTWASTDRGSRSRCASTSPGRCSSRRSRRWWAAPSTPASRC